MPEETKTETATKPLAEGLKPSDRSRKTRKVHSAKHDRMAGKKIKEKKKIKEALLVFSEGKDGNVCARLVMGKVVKTSTDQLTVEGMTRLKAWAVQEAAGARITPMVQAEGLLKESGSTTGFLKSHPSLAVYIAYLHIRGWKMARAALTGQGHAEFYSGGGYSITIENGKWKLEHHGSNVSGNTPDDLEDELNRQMI